MEEIYPILAEVLASGGEFRLYPGGVSMLPLLREGKDSVILVTPKAPRKRAVYLYRRADGSFVLHRLIGMEKDGTLTFSGDNQIARERGVPAAALLAEMSAFYRGERRIETANVRYRLWVRLHTLWLVRRTYFFARAVWRKLFRRKKAK